MKLRAENLVKKYGVRTVVKGVSMEVNQGEIVGFLGPNGAGKTTSFYMITGQIVPNEGRIFIDDDELTGLPMYKRSQKGVGYLPQEASVFRKMSVEDNIMSVMEMTKMTREEREARVNEVMEIFGLTPVRNNLVVKLSGGQRKRLSIAMEFISNPTLFILDEPDSGLDGVMARELFQQLRQIADQGKIIIVITHTPDRVIDLFDDVIVLAKDANRTGRLALFGPI